MNVIVEPFGPRPPRRLTLFLTAYGALCLGASTSLAAAGTPAVQKLAEVVIEATPLPGPTVGLDAIPGNVQVLSAADLSREGTASLTTALDSRLSSININDDLDDRYQPDIQYRGFDASPVLGTPQGLAVYQNGVRINEAFGDTVNWDLIPALAIDRVELVSSSAVYGLNALGGAISVAMKNGFTYQGRDLELSGGSYGNRNATAEYGVRSGALGLYVAGRAVDSDGWREFSSDRLRNLYAVLSVHTHVGTLDVSYTRANDFLDGQGATPIQELAVSRSLVFTGPQANENSLNFVTLNGTLELADDWSLQTVLYYRDYAQSVQNGNTTNYVACTSTAAVLCQPDGVTPLTNPAGEPLADISHGAALFIGENDFEQIHAWSRGATLQISSGGSILGHTNRLTLGIAVDYASTSYYTGAQIGLLNSQLLVLPSSLLVNTPENSPAAIANGDPVPVSVDSVNKNLGAYFTDTLNLTHALALTASGRYNISHINLVDQLGSKLTGFNRFVHFNPAVGATYRLGRAATVYGGYSENTRTPTASEIECSDPLTPCLLPTDLAGDPPDLSQVIAHTTELGARGRVPRLFGRAGVLSWSLSVFRTLLHNDIYGVATSLSQGFFKNIGDTRREGLEAGVQYRALRWSAYANYSLVQATFRSAFVMPSPSNPYHDAMGDIHVQPADRLPGIPEHRIKIGADLELLPRWSVGATVSTVSSFYYAGDEANRLAPIPGYTVVDLHSTYRPGAHVELFASIDNLFDHRYSTWGILSHPTGVGAPGVPADGIGVDNRFLSPAAPLEVSGGVRIDF
jgi:iron complex outermembrane recepter protein